MRMRMLVPTAVAALALAGCGIGGSSPGSSGTEDTADLAAQIAAVTDEELSGTAVTMARFFGDCAETTGQVTDIAEAATECEAIQILTNQFVAENEWGISVERLGGTAWDSYYDGLNAALASNERPNVAVMHGSYLSDYADQGMLVAVPDGIGIDLSGATGPATDAVAYQGTSYAVPFDLHAIVSHLNLDLLAEAGLTDADGTYTMPTSPEGLLADALQFSQATGKTYLDVALSNDPMGGRLWMSLMWQQGTDFIDADTRTASADSEQAVTALELINTMAEAGYIDRTHDYDASQQAFLRGESAIMYNGSWAVNQYDAEAEFNYQVTDAPMLFQEKATWADSHTWAVPVQPNGDPVAYRAAFEFASFMYQHTADWAIATGHMPSSIAGLESADYLAAPHRDQYLDTATEYGHMQPRLVEWPAIGDLVRSRVEATWLNGAPVESTLATLQSDINSKLQ